MKIDNPIFKYITIFLVIVVIIYFAKQEKAEMLVLQNDEDSQNNGFFYESNPLILAFKISGEKNFFEKVEFETYVTFTESVGKEYKCIPKSEFPFKSGTSLWCESCGDCYAPIPKICQSKGYEDRSYNCENCNECNVCCQKNLLVTTEWIEIKDNDKALLKFEKNEYTNKKILELSEIINEKCKEQIDKCYISEDLCEDCIFELQVHSQNNGGSLKISTYPKTLQYKDKTTTTIFQQDCENIGYYHICPEKKHCEMIFVDTLSRYCYKEKNNNFLIVLEYFAVVIGISFISYFIAYNI